MEILKSKELPIEYLRECFLYDPLTGLIVWKERPMSHFSHSTKADGGFNTKYAGKVAGSLMRRGYIWITLNGQSHFAHRLAWALFHGEYPIDLLDHENGIKTDNRISNLIPASCSENSRNQKLRRTNTSGHMGVHFRKDNGKYRSFIQQDGKRVWLGSFDTYEQALAVRKAAEIEFGYHPNHGR